MTVRLPLPPAALDSGVIAVLRADDPNSYLPACLALVQEGVTALELTLTTPGTLAVLPHLRRELPRASLGVGTVLSTDQAAAAVDAGADFLVTPVADRAIVQAGVSAGIPVIPGALTPTEVHDVWAAGAAAVKIFPAVTVGPDYVRQLAGPFPHLRVVPSGGVRIEDIAAWIHAGAVAVSVGGPMLGDALCGGDLQQLAVRARAAVAAVRTARASR